MIPRRPLSSQRPPHRSHRQVQHLPEQGGTPRFSIPVPGCRLSEIGAIASPWPGPTCCALIGSALYITLCGLFAFAAAAIIRNTAGTITAMFGLLFVIPTLVNLLPHSWGNDLVQWLPSSAARAISATVGRESAPVLLVGPVHRVRRLHRGPAGRGRHPVPQAGRLISDRADRYMIMVALARGRPTGRGSMPRG